MNSKNKGKRGEREFSKLLGESWPARRTGHHQDKRGHGVADVTCESLPVHWEVKRQERVVINEWLDQARRDAPPSQIPIVAWRRNNAPWYAFLPMDALVKILSTADLGALEQVINENTRNERHTYNGTEVLPGTVDTGDGTGGTDAEL